MKRWRVTGFDARGLLVGQTYVRAVSMEFAAEVGYVELYGAVSLLVEEVFE